MPKRSSDVCSNRGIDSHDCLCDVEFWAIVNAADQAETVFIAPDAVVGSWGCLLVGL